MFVLKRQGGTRTNQLASAQEYLCTDHRVLFLYGPLIMSGDMGVRLDAFGPVAICDSLLALDKLNQEPIKLIVHSNGGYLDAAMAVYDTMKSIRSPVWTVSRLAVSAATLILAGGELGHRYMYPNSRLMIHMPRSSLGLIDYDAMARETREAKKVLDMVAQVYIDNGARKNKGQIIKDMRRTTWFGLEEAMEYGLVDQVVQEGVL